MADSESILLTVLVLSSILIISGCTQPSNKYECGDGFCDKDAGESITNCFKDCSQPNPCGDGTCSTNEDCLSCPDDCRSCPVLSGESRFGIHVGMLHLKSEISELGGIYSRINIGPDAHGWKGIKSTQQNIDLCESCCREQPNCISECIPGAFYYCEPENREEGIIGKDIADEFYADDYEILFAVSPGSYGNEPKNIQDFLSFDYPADEQIYKDYIEYLIKQYPDVKYWEVLNEADNPQFWGDTPENYANLVTLTSSEIKSHCPECKVGISLVGPNPSDEWFTVITSICNNIEFVDLHQYHSETMDELKTFEANDLTKWKNSCPGVEIISTETGIPDSPFTQKGVAWELGTSETKQAQDSIKYLTMMFNAGYSKIYYYLFDLDFVPDVPDMFELNGLLNEDNSKKTTFDSYKIMINKTDYFTSISKLADGQYKYTFTLKDPVYVLWCDEEPCYLTSEILSSTATFKVTDYEGNSQTTNSNEITLSESPIFVESI